MTLLMLQVIMISTYQDNKDFGFSYASLKNYAITLKTYNFTPCFVCVCNSVFDFKRGAYIDGARK